MNCDGKYNSELCQKCHETIRYDGTKIKIQFMKQYISAWYNKVLRYKPKYGEQAKGVVFIDCMSNSGAYEEEGLLIKGTAQHAEELFLNQNGSCYRDRAFKIYLNDVSKERVNCQLCIWRSKQNDRKNVEVSIFNKDVYDFLKEEGNYILDKAKLNNWYVLLFYDPYYVQFDWDILSPFINYHKTDIILTHFWKNDTKRALGQNVKNKQVKNKYEKAYGIDYEELYKNLKTMNHIESNEYLRELFKKQIVERTSKNKYIGIAPIFNRTNNVVYDIVSVSTSVESRNLLKNIMHKLMKDFKKVPENEQLEFQLFEDSVYSYRQARALGISEVDYFNSITYFSKVMCSELKGKTVTQKQMNSYLKNHDLIPTNCKTELKKSLKVKGVKIKKHKQYGQLYTFI